VARLKNNNTDPFLDDMNKPCKFKPGPVDEILDDLIIGISPREKKSVGRFDADLI
jgi:hypothetical protein